MCDETSPHFFCDLLKNFNLQKHNSTPEEYEVKVVNNIIFDERKRTVSLFKDYLLLDEVNDFLKRFYYISESKLRIPKIYEFYSELEPYVPSYAVIKQKEILIKNYRRKRRVILEKENHQENKQKLAKEKFSAFLKSELLVDDSLSEQDSCLSTSHNRHNAHDVNSAHDMTLHVDPFTKKRELPVKELSLSLSGIETLLYEDNTFEDIQLVSGNTISNSQEQENIPTCNEMYEILKLENTNRNKSVSRVLNLSQIAIDSEANVNVNGNAKLKDTNFNNPLIKKVTVNKQAILKKQKESENIKINKRILNDNFTNKKKFSRGKSTIREASKSKMTKVPYLLHNVHVNTGSETRDNNKNTLTSINNLISGKNIRNSSSKPQQMCSIKSKIFRKLTKSNSIHNINLRNYESTLISASKRDDNPVLSNPLTIQILSNSKEKDMAVYNISVNLNFNVRVTNTENNCAKNMDNSPKIGYSNKLNYKNPLNNVIAKSKSKDKDKGSSQINTVNTMNSERMNTVSSTTATGFYSNSSSMTYRTPAGVSSMKTLCSKTSLNKKSSTQSIHQNVEPCSIFNKRYQSIEKKGGAGVMKNSINKSTSNKVINPTSTVHNSHNSHNYNSAPWKAILKLNTCRVNSIPSPSKLTNLTKFTSTLDTRGKHSCKTLSNANITNNIKRAPSSNKDINDEKLLSKNRSFKSNNNTANKYANPEIKVEKLYKLQPNGKYI